MPYPNDTGSVLQGLLQSYRPQNRFTFGGGFGEDADEIHDRPPTQGELQSPFEREMTQRASMANAADEQKLAGLRHAQTQAGLQGYADPQQMFAAQRQAELQKQQMPLEIERERSRGNLAVATERGGQAAELARVKGEAQTEALQKLFGGGGVQPGGRVSVSGVGSVSAPKQEPAIAGSTLNQLARARKDLEASRGWFSSGDTAKKQQLDQLIAGAVANHPSTPTAKTYAQSIMSHPQTAKMPFEEIMAAAQRKGVVSAEDMAHLQELLMIIRGF